MTSFNSTLTMKIFLPLLAAAAWAGSLGIGSAAVIADFTDGNTTSAVDGYAGKAGGGWTGAWNNPTSNITYAATVTNTSPLKAGSGNYLSITASSPGSVANSQASVNRQYSSGISLTQEVKFEFLFRADVISSQTRYTIFDAPASQPATGANMTWEVALNGSTWYLYSGNGAGGGSEISTGLTATAGTTYAFTILANPTAKTFTVSIANTLGTVLYTSGTTTFRSSAASLGGYLTFSTVDSDPSSPTSLASSIDGISITQVPEPGTVALLGLGGAAFLWMRRRK